MPTNTGHLLFPLTQGYFILLLAIDVGTILPFTYAGAFFSLPQGKDYLFAPTDARHDLLPLTTIAWGIFYSHEHRGIYYSY